MCTEVNHHCILFGGDQLTVCCSHVAKSAHSHDDKSEEWCEGLIPVVEDWHARMTLVKVIQLIYVRLIISICNFSR